MAGDLRLVVLQPTSLCNLNCRYCYVVGRQDPARMDDATLEAAIRAVLESSLVDGYVEFLWHAGEPLTAGIPFYEHAFALAEHYRPRDLAVGHSIQTNGTLINERWVALLAQHDVQVGLSLDGPAWLHDRHRPTWSGRGSHSHAMRGLRLLQEAGIPIGALCVLTRDSLEVPDEIYDFFVGAAVGSVGFNIEETEGAHRRSSLSKGRPPLGLYRRFMERIWERWSAEPERLQIRELDRVLRVLLERGRDATWHPDPDETIGFRNVTIDKDGNVTTFSPEFGGGVGQGTMDFVLGNVHRQPLDELATSERYRELASAVQEGVDACRATCGYFDLCGAGFVSNKYFEHGTVRATETVSCRLHRMALTDVVLEQLVAESGRRREAA
jgi:uncharacterized protein